MLSELPGKLGAEAGRLGPDARTRLKEEAEEAQYQFLGGAGLSFTAQRC